MQKIGELLVSPDMTKIYDVGLGLIIVMWLTDESCVLNFFPIWTYLLSNHTVA